MGDYLSIGRSYQKLLSYCKNNSYKILSDAYEFCINDYLTSHDENEYITKIVFYVEQGRSGVLIVRKYIPMLLMTKAADPENDSSS